MTEAEKLALLEEFAAELGVDLAVVGMACLRAAVETEKRRRPPVSEPAGA